MLREPLRMGRDVTFRNPRPEFAVGTGRADLVVDFGERVDVIELKILRGAYTLAEGVTVVVVRA